MLGSIATVQETGAISAYRVSMKRQGGGSGLRSASLIDAGTWHISEALVPESPRWEERGSACGANGEDRGGILDGVMPSPGGRDERCSASPLHPRACRGRAGCWTGGAEISKARAVMRSWVCRPAASARPNGATRTKTPGREPPHGRSAFPAAHHVRGPIHDAPRPVCPPGAAFGSSVEDGAARNYGRAVP